jgi:hypothetical protein
MPEVFRAVKHRFYRLTCYRKITESLSISDLFGLILRKEGIQVNQ